MDLKRIIFRYFLPMVVSFFVLSGITSWVVPVQNSYYPLFEKLTLSAGESGNPDIYFKTRKGTQEVPMHPDKVTLLFNSKAYLQQIIDRAKATGTKGSYDYKGVVISISEYFVTPLVFLFSLLLVTPSSIPRKLLNLLIGGLLVIGFAYFTVKTRVNYGIIEAGLPGMSFDPREARAYQLISYAFSSVTTITVVLLIWILLAFRKSDLSKAFNMDLVSEK